MLMVNFVIIIINKPFIKRSIRKSTCSNALFKDNK